MYADVLYERISCVVVLSFVLAGSDGCMYWSVSDEDVRRVFPDAIVFIPARQAFSVNIEQCSACSCAIIVILEWVF